MKKLMLILALLGSTLAFGQEDACPGDLYGNYVSEEGELLIINSLNEFTRSQNGIVITSGTIECKDNIINVFRENGDQYGLVYFIGDMSVVIAKPNCNQAWIWNRLQ